MFCLYPTTRATSPKLMKYDGFIKSMGSGAARFSLIAGSNRQIACFRGRVRASRRGSDRQDFLPPGPSLLALWLRL